jgi:hypothetical protein
MLKSQQPMGGTDMSSSRSFLRVIIGAVIAGSLAASVLPANAAIYPPRQALPQQQIQQFLANPSSLLTQFPNGGAQMIQTVRDLLASDPTTLTPLLALLTSANPDQQTAIGTAAGQVALMSLSVEPAFGPAIQDALAAAKNNTLALAAYDAVVGGDIKLTAATGGVGGGGGGGPIGQTVGLSGFFAGTPGILSTSARNAADTFIEPTFGSSSPGTLVTTAAPVTGTTP